MQKGIMRIEYIGIDFYIVSFYVVVEIFLEQDYEEIKIVDINYIVKENKLLLCNGVLGISVFLFL